MKIILNVILSSLILLNAAQGAPQPESCPVTLAVDPLAGLAFPGWYGTEGLAVQFSGEAMVWPTTKPDALMAGRLVWRSAGFRPGTESSLETKIENLEGGAVTARISGATNAYIPPLQPGGSRPSESEVKAMIRQAEVSEDGWRMLTGVDFPQPGCWRVSADYLGQKLTFVIESVSIDEWKARFSQ